MPPPAPLWQTPVWQVIGAVQTEHAPPLSPHLAEVGTATQVLPSQQPLPQVVALHGGAQAPFEHGWPEGQITQLAPSVPHAPSALPAWHTLAVSLQPIVQTVTAQPAIWHDWPAGQVAQGLPVFPQL